MVVKDTTAENITEYEEVFRREGNQNILSFECCLKVVRGFNCVMSKVQCSEAIRQWNNLPPEVVCAQLLEVFKKKN